MSLLLPLSAFAGVPLTLLNLLVVLLAAAGWCVVARMLARRSVVAGDVAYFGLSLLVLGGLGRSLEIACNQIEFTHVGFPPLPSRGLATRS